MDVWLPDKTLGTGTGTPGLLLWMYGYLMELYR